MMRGEVAHVAEDIQGEEMINMCIATFTISEEEWILDSGATLRIIGNTILVSGQVRILLHTDY